MEYSSYNLTNGDKIEELGFHFESDNAISPSMFLPTTSCSQNFFYPPEQTQITQLLPNEDRLNSDNVISENYYNLAHHLEPTRLKNDEQSSKIQFNYQTAKPMCSLEKLNPNIQFQLNENNLNHQGTLERMYFKNEHHAVNENDLKIKSDILVENANREDAAELLQFDVNILVDNDGNLVSQIAETVVPVALSKASQEDHEIPLKKNKIKQPSKNPARLGTLERMYFKNEHHAVNENDLKIKSDTLVENANREDAAELLQFDVNILVDNDGNLVSQIAETVVPVALSKASQEDHEKPLKKNKIKQPSKNPARQMAGYLLVEEPNFEISEVYTPQTTLEEPILEFPEVDTLQTTTEEPKLEIPEVNRLQAAPEESNLEIHEGNTLETRNEDLKLETPKDNVFLTAIEELDSNIPEANIVEALTTDSNSTNMPHFIFLETKSMSKKVHSSLEDIQVTNLVNSILSKHAEEVVKKRLGIHFPNKQIQRPVKKRLGIHFPNKQIQRPVKKRCSNTNIDPVSISNLVQETVKNIYKNYKDSVASKTENLNLVRIPKKTYSRKKKVSESIVDLKIAHGLPENKLIITNIDGAKDNPISIDEENPISTVKPIKTYSRNIPVAISKPAMVPVGISKPAMVPVGISKPAMVPVGISKPAIVPVGISKPAIIPFGISKPSMVPFGISKPAMVPVGISKPAMVPVGISKPAMVPVGLSKPGMVPVGISKPTMVPVGISKPTMVPVGISKPTMVPVGISKPTMVPVGISKPAMVPVGLSKPAMVPVGLSRPTVIKSLSSLQYESLLSESILPIQHLVEKPANTANWNMAMDSLDSEDLLIPELVPFNIVKPEKEDEVIVPTIKVEPEVKVAPSILRAELENEVVQQVHEEKPSIKIENDFHEHQPQMKPIECYSNLTKPPIASPTQFSVNKISQIMTGESNLEDPEINTLETQTKDSNSQETKSVRCCKAHQSYDEVEIPSNTEKWNTAMNSLHSELVLMPQWVPLNVVEPEKEDEVTTCILKVELENEVAHESCKLLENVALMSKPNEHNPNLTKLSIASTSKFRVNKTTLKMPVVVLERLKFPINTKTSSRKTNSTVVETNSELSTFEIGSKLSSSKRTIDRHSKQRDLKSATDTNLASILGTDKIPVVRLHRYIPPKKSIKVESFKKSPIDVTTKSSEQETSCCKKINHNRQEDVIKLWPTLVPKSSKSSSIKINRKNKILMDKPNQRKNIKKPKIKNGLKELTLKKLPKKINIQSLDEVVVDKIMSKFDDQVLRDQDTLPTSCKFSVSFSHSSCDNQTSSLVLVDDQSESMRSVNNTSSVSLDQVKPSTSHPDYHICETLVRELISEVLLEETISEVVLNTSFSFVQEDHSIFVALMKDLISEVLMEETISKVVEDEPVFEVAMDESLSKALIRPPISETIIHTYLIKDVSTLSESVELTYKTVDPVFEPEVFHHILETVKKAKAKGKRKNKYLCEICRKKCISKFELSYHKKSVHNVGRMVLDRYKCPNCELSFSRKYDYEKHRYSTHNVKKFTCKLCANQFASLPLLRDHERRHNSHKFKCLFCRKEFKHLSGRNRHMYCHTTSRPFKCNLCPKSFITNSLLDRHKRVHKDKKEIRCRRCNIVLEDWQKYMEHVNNIHRRQEQYNCEICSKSFSTKAVLTRHKVLNHFDKGKLLVCEICEAPFSSLQKLKRHRKIHNKEHHCVTCSKSFALACTLKNHITEWHSNLRPFKCDLCEKAFSNQVFLNRHKRLHTDGVRKTVKTACPICKREVINLGSHTQFCHPDKNQVVQVLEKIDPKWLALKCPCFVCKAVYETELELKEHICSDKRGRKSMVLQFLCLICKRTFRNDTLREEHCTKSHIPFTRCTFKKARKCCCQICKEQFDTKDAKNEHTKSHFNQDGTIINPFPCELCDKKFASKWRLKEHMSVHNGSKEFSCPICFKLFRVQSYLKTHMKIHTGEKKYKCKYCGRKFTCGSAKTKHEMIHTGERPYSCNICGKAFNRKAAVGLHMLSHTKEIPHECMFCGAKYRYSCKFKQHLKKHIKAVDDEEIILGN